MLDGGLPEVTNTVDDMFNYLTWFMPNMADISGPLRVLLVKDKDWVLNMSQQK